MKKALAACFLLLIAFTWWFWPRFVLNRVAAASEQAGALPEAGQYGDLYGSLTAGLTALTLAGVVITIYLQRSQLDLAKKEAADETDARRADALEQHFFQMLDLLIKGVDRIRYATDVFGVEALRLRAKDILQQSDSLAKKTSEKEWALHLRPTVVDNINSSATEHFLTPFFESFYLLVEHVLSHIDARPRQDDFPVRLLRILVATLGHNVLGLAILHAEFLGQAREKNLIHRLCLVAPFSSKDGSTVVTWALARAAASSS